ncbi:MAG: hypothetical protein GY805_20660, partial [Chloroflexi bacterium]|nr:hypothetical protein [Chloroflexota bacterium]
MKLFTLSNSKIFLFTGLVVALLTAVTPKHPASIAKAAPAATANNLCFSIYLPIIIGGAGVAPPDDGAVPVDLPHSYESCEGFPDFNGDGYADLAIGIPSEDITIEGLTFVDAGSVQVIYGTANGLNASAAGESLHNDQVWHRGREGLAVLINISIGDNFGQALAPGDFNNDGYDDLAIGVPGSLIDGNDDVGAVQVMYGSSDGLTVEKSQTWSQDNASIIGSPEAGDRFGETLAAGDFNGDGVTDLAIGVPDEGVLAGADQTQAGAINIIYSSGIGLSTLYDDLLTQNSVMFFASAEPYDHFGDVLTSGDFNGDGIDDLAVGIPFEDDSGGEVNAGAVQIYFGGTDSGILDADGEGTPIYPQQITANTTGVDNALEAGD